MTMVSDSHKFIYIVGGRTASVSTRIALRAIPNLKYHDPARKFNKRWKRFNKHLPAKFIKRLVTPDEWENYFKFTFVRNTYSWVVSSFFLRVRKGKYPEPKNGIMSMDDFKYITNYYRTPKGRRHDRVEKIRSQHSFICDRRGNPLVDFIGRFEHIQKDFNTVCKIIGVDPIHLPVRNSSAASTSRIHWLKHYQKTPEAQKFVYKHWKRDIDAFKFKLSV